MNNSNTIQYNTIQYNTIQCNSSNIDNNIYNNVNDMNNDINYHDNDVKVILICLFSCPLSVTTRTSVVLIVEVNDIDDLCVHF